MAFEHSSEIALAKGVGVVGGGAAGLSIAKLLQEAGVEDVTVFEADDRVGGKSLSRYMPNTVVEMGTCYLTFAHAITKGWMKQCGIGLVRMNDVKFDGGDFMDYARAGDGAPMMVQVARYLLEARRLQREMAAAAPSAKTLNEAATPAADWLAARKLWKIERLMHRAINGMGYGLVSETPIWQALTWLDAPLLATGLLDRLMMPDAGWSAFWERLAEGIDVRLSTPVASVRRMSDAVIIDTPEGSHRFSQVVCAIPLDDFTALTTPTEDEVAVNGGVVWNGFATTLISSPDWFTHWRVESESRSVGPDCRPGQVLGVRYEGHESELGGGLYVFNQAQGPYSAAELREIAEAHVRLSGATVGAVVDQRMWKYFAQYKPGAIRNGLVQRLRRMQGDARTWYTGAAFSFEAVAQITNLNARLTPHLVRRLSADVQDAKAA